MDDLLVRVLFRLLRIHDELGERAYRDAGNRALVAIARAAQTEAELRVAGNNEGVVVPIHHAHRIRARDNAGTD